MLTQHDSDLGLKPVTSIDDLVSPEARALAERFGVALDEIPRLRKLQHDYGQALQTGTAPPDVMAEKPLVYGATAIMLYERAARKGPFKLVLPGKDDADTALYDHELHVTPTDKAFAQLYEKKAIQAKSAAQA